MIKAKCPSTIYFSLKFIDDNCVITKKYKVTANHVEVYL